MSAAVTSLPHSLWALSTGGMWGSGPGYGDPVMISCRPHGT